jgi:3',5'-cyclic AMP phosphodiesterase CpdA
MATRIWIVLLMLSALLSGACAPSAQSAPSSAVKASASARLQETGAIEVLPPVAEGSLRFAAMGDSGTGDRHQYETAATMARARQIFPYEFVIMMGDNLYGSERPQDYEGKFVLPYKPLLDAGVKFYASLGNHDDPNQRFYKPFNMNGERYYTFTKKNVRFFALDSNYMDRDQLAWLRRELAAPGPDWKIAFFHHPLYSSGGTHGSEVDLRTQVEPLFLQYGVSVVFAGHEHFYERIKPQKGIQYFTTGAAAKLREGDIEKSDLTAAGFDTDRSFMLLEISEDVMTFQTITSTGRRVDSGTVTKVKAATDR